MVPPGRRGGAVARGSSRSRQPSAGKAKKNRVVETELDRVIFGDLVLEPWYSSQYPEEADPQGAGELCVCPFCFKYSASVTSMAAHVTHCTYFSNPPPGREVYRHNEYSVYEVDGEEQKLYSQNLSLFGKLFLETKSVFYDVAIFNFYVLVLRGSTPTMDPDESSQVTLSPAGTGGLTEGRPPSRRAAAAAVRAGLSTMNKKAEEQRWRVQPSTAGPGPGPGIGRVVGFFSKEKISWDGNNLACILVFPPWLGRGLGQLLMATSYELSRREGKVGGPERPLSDLGLRSYLLYWSSEIARYLMAQPDPTRTTVQDISDDTFILPQDILDTLAYMGLISSSSSIGDVDMVTSGDTEAEDADSLPERIFISRPGLLDWVARRGIKAETEPLVVPDGFLVGYSERGVEFADRVEERRKARRASGL